MNYGTIMHNASYSIALYETTNASLWYYTPVSFHFWFYGWLIIAMLHFCCLVFPLETKVFSLLCFFGAVVVVMSSHFKNHLKWQLTNCPFKMTVKILRQISGLLLLWRSHSPANCCWTKCCCCCCNNANDCCCPWLAAAEAAAPAMAWLR